MIVGLSQIPAGQKNEEKIRQVLKKVMCLVNMNLKVLFLTNVRLRKYNVNLYIYIYIYIYIFIPAPALRWMKSR